MLILSSFICELLFTEKLILFIFITDHDHSKFFDFNCTGSAFVIFFSNLFASSSLLFVDDFHGLILPIITESQNILLTANPDISKVHKAVFSMENNKSLGLNGMSPVFYKSYWSIVGKDALLAVQGFFFGMQN